MGESNQSQSSQLKMTGGTINGTMTLASSCCSTIRTTKKGYNSATRSTVIAASAENERKTRSRAVSELSLSDSSTAESSPATTDNEQATTVMFALCSTTYSHTT